MKITMRCLIGQEVRLERELRMVQLWEQPELNSILNLSRIAHWFQVITLWFRNT